VVLDVHLPDGNGFDVCRKLKANPATSSIPIVMFSSISQTGSAVNDARQLGAAAFLFFPMVREHLISVVLGTLSSSKPQTTPE
jgi:CheY-like chemotaxis protein